MMAYVRSCVNGGDGRAVLWIIYYIRTHSAARTHPGGSRGQKNLKYSNIVFYGVYTQSTRVVLRYPRVLFRIRFFMNHEFGVLFFMYYDDVRCNSAWEDDDARLKNSDESTFKMTFTVEENSKRAFRELGRVRFPRVFMHTERSASVTCVRNVIKRFLRVTHGRAVWIIDKKDLNNNVNIRKLLLSASSTA